MKKVILLFVMLFMFSSSFIVNAEEAVPNRKTPDERFDILITRLEEKREQHIERQEERWSERQQVREERSDDYLDIVAEYAPELLSDYEAAIATHNTLHETLFNTRMSLKTNYSDETLAALYTLKVDLYAQAEAGEITWREVQETIKDFLQNSRETFKSNKEAYKEAILEAQADWEEKTAEIKSLREDLAKVLNVNDTDAVVEIIETLYDCLLEHIEFDQFKLDTLNSMF